MSRTDGAPRPPARPSWTPRAGSARDPWAGTPTGELSDQVLPRWFVLTALVLVPVALVAVVAAFVVAGPDEVPLAARRPPPADGLTHAVGDYQVADADPRSVPEPCPALVGVRVAGSEDDRATLAAGLAPLCDLALDPPVAARLEAVGDAGGVVRLAAFEDTGVDVTAPVDGSAILVNGRFAATPPPLIGPLVVSQLATLAGDPATAATALAARRAEAAACAALPADVSPSRACADAAALVALPDPLAALRAAGYR